MRLKLPTLIFALALLAADSPADDASKKDLEKLQGDWVGVSYMRDGEKADPDDAQSLFRTIKDDTYTISRFDKQIGKGTFTIDATKKPKTIDAYPGGSKDKNKVVRGIYELKGNTLKICSAAPGKDRPTEFTSKEGSGHTLTVWEREKK
jgi:uncharacterized protein (TIGR03067 family)